MDLKNGSEVREEQTAKRVKNPESGTDGARQPLVSTLPTPASVEGPKSLRKEALVRPDWPAAIEATRAVVAATEDLCKSTKG